MTLRIILVGLVASMGFELPGGGGVFSRAGSGRDQPQAASADRSGCDLGADRPEAAPTDCRQAEAHSRPVKSATVEGADARGDAAFLAASEAMAAGFVADSMATLGDATPELIACEGSPPVGLPEGEESSGSVAMSEAGQGPDAVEADEMLGEPVGRGERVSSAIRLTREAFHAWSELVQESASEADLAR